MDFTLCLTHDCNLACSYCYAGRKFRKRMDWRTAEAAVDFAVDRSVLDAKLIGGVPKIQLGFFGGEPLLEWDMLVRSTEYLDRRAAEKGIELKKTLTTNMTLLNEERADWLKSNGFFLGLSLDGNKEMHDCLRKFKDGRSSHAACSRALQWFRGTGAPGELIIVVDPRNVKYLAASLDWLVQDQNIMDISLNPNFYIKWSDEALKEWRLAYEHAADIYLEAYRNNKYLRINFIDSKIKSRLKDGYANCDKCGFGESEIAVSPAGNIYPCERIVSDDTNSELCLGDVFSGFRKDVRDRILAARGNRNDECVSCSLRERCMNWCCCINYATTGKIDRVDGVVCYHERIAIEIADRVGETLYSEANPYFLAKFYGPA